MNTVFLISAYPLFDPYIVNKPSEKHGAPERSGVPELRSRALSAFKRELVTAILFFGPRIPTASFPALFTRNERRYQ